MRKFGKQTTTDEVLSGMELSGKLAVVTGASAGLGIETSRVLAANGARVIMAVRDLEKGEKARQAILEDVPAGQLSLLELDLSEQDSVRRAAANFSAGESKLDILINNAGVMACPLQFNSDGCEHQFGTNHIGHFLFTCSLLPALRAADHARVVNLSSAGHQLSGVDFDDLNFERREYDKWVAYGQAKSANVLFTVGLQNRLVGTGIDVFAVHPGVIMTELSRHLVQQDLVDLAARAEQRGAKMEFKTIPRGAATSVWAATAPELAGKGGIYLEDCQIALSHAEYAAGGYHEHAVNPQYAEQLWSLSEDIVDQQFSF
jgi:NAD(P)-dependent dehydrogenase (short-subunit alcohol dehydrogenase family)